MLEREQIWEEYKAAWRMGKSPEMSSDTFSKLFCLEYISFEATALVKSSPAAHKTIHASTRSSLRNLEKYYQLFHNDQDLIRVWLAVQGKDDVNRIILAERLKIENMESRVSFLEYFVSGVIRHFGREWVRDEMSNWWRNAIFVEEEQEIFLIALSKGKVLNWFLLGRLGADAVEKVKRLIRQERISAKKIDGFSVSNLRDIRGSQEPNWLSARIGSLLQPVMLPVDVRDACLQPDELSKVTGGYQGNFFYDESLLWKTLERMRHYSREMDILADAYTQIDRKLPHFQDMPSNTPPLCFPLIRFLHLRLLLEAPALTQAKKNPEIFLVPEVLMFTLGREAVTYSPELRMHRDTDRRWRARWVESAAEALSTLFLEMALDIDFSTLSRIPEVNNKRTPDFRVETLNEEPIVFEVKGATNWKTHQKQQKEALIQLGKKHPNSQQSNENTISWVGRGRSFALSLFAAQQGDNKSSIFHADDPIFTQNDFFSKGWKEEARRSHYVAVLEAAQLFEVASNLRHSRYTEEIRHKYHKFSIDGHMESEKKSSLFFGNFLNIQDVALRLNHPDLQAIAALKIFVGVEESVFYRLKQNDLPECKRGYNTDDLDKVEYPPIISDWGLLPGHKRSRPARGVYSLLSDGAFLAIELD